MNREEIMQRAEVAVAMAEGQTVQSRFKAPHWTDYDGTLDKANLFDPTVEWRIKPKPVECWVFVPEHRHGSLEVCGGWVTESGLPKREPPIYQGRWVRMREIDE